MNVLFITRFFFPHVGGVEKHVYEVSRRLKSMGINISIVTEKYAPHLKSQEVVNKTLVKRLFYPKLKFLGLIFIWLWFLKNIDLIKKADIVHVHDVFVWYLPFKFLFPKKKVYTTFHGWEGIYPIPRKNILLKRIAWKLSQKTMSVGSYLKKYYGVSSDIIIYGATDIPRKKFRKDKKLIVYIGRLDEDTDLPLFLETLGKMDPKKDGFRIEFCGDGSLRKECERFGKVHGFTDPRLFLSKAQFCFAHGYLTILEALAYRCLVFVVYKDKIRKDIFYLTPFREFLLIFNNPQDLIKKLRFYSIRGKNEILVEKAFEWVKDYTWENLARKYLELWDIDPDNFK